MPAGSAWREARAVGGSAEEASSTVARGRAGCVMLRQLTLSTWSTDESPMPAPNPPGLALLVAAPILWSQCLVNKSLISHKPIRVLLQLWLWACDLLACWCVSVWECGRLTSTLSHSLIHPLHSQRLSPQVGRAGGR